MPFLRFVSEQADKTDKQTDTLIAIVQITTEDDVKIQF